MRIAAAWMVLLLGLPGCGESGTKSPGAPGTGAIGQAAPGDLSAPAQRGAELCTASLKIIRAQHLVMAGKLELDAADRAAEQAFHRTVQLESPCVSQWARTGQSSCAAEITNFLDAARRLPERAAPGDPASVLRTVMSGAAESAPQVDRLFDGYAALFQLSLEVERDGTLLQDFLPMLIAAGCPTTLKDFGLDQGNPGRLTELATQAAGLTATMPYATARDNYLITFVKLDNWASKFSGQVTPDTLAARALDSGVSQAMIARLRARSASKIGFLGDSQMDRIHWSSQYPFPDIVGAALQQINPGMTVINAGKGGDDSGEGLARIDAALIAHQPDIVFVLFGSNDARHHGRPEPVVTPEQYRSNLTGIVQRLRAADSRVVIMSYPRDPARKGPDLVVFEAMRVQAKQVAESLGTGWLDIAAVLDAEPPETVFAMDGIHFNPRTQVKIARMVLIQLAAMDD